MGTASFSVSAAPTSDKFVSSKLRTSGAFTTTTTAANLEDAGGDIELGIGEVLVIHADEAMRVTFGGTAATASTGHYIPAGEAFGFECHPGDDGTVSIIDVA